MADSDSAASHESANVFISYSRKDKDFAVRLTDALKAAGKQSWIDWDNIPLTAQWQDQVNQGIDSTDVFVIVVSRNSLVSEHCNKEMEKARLQHKRIVPVVLQEIDIKAVAGEWFQKPWEQMARDNWAEIQKWQWLTFQENDDFTQSLAKLIVMIDKDLNYVQTHTQWLKRAQDWDKKGRNESLMLRGDELQEAEEWLFRSVTKEPPPSKLHQEFIEASQKADKRRRTLEAELVNQAKTAEARANKFRNRFLYFLVLVTAVGISAYLGGRGSQIHAEDETARSDDATSWSPDETRVLTIDTARSDKLVYVWDDVTGEKLLTLVGHTDTVRDAAWSPDGTKIATASIDNTARIWDAATGKELLRFTEHTDHINVIAWSPDGTRLVTGGDDRIARVWDATTGKVLTTFDLHDSAITSAHWAHDGSEIITTDHNRRTYIWDATTGKEKVGFSGTGRS